MGHCNSVRPAGLHSQPRPLTLIALVDVVMAILSRVAGAAAAGSSTHGSDVELAPAPVSTGTGAASSLGTQGTA